MAVTTAEVARIAAGRNPDEVDALFRQALAEVLPAGTVQPRWIATRTGLAGVFQGYRALEDFADWCAVLDIEPASDFGPPPEVELWADASVRGHLIRVRCVADESEARRHFRICPAWAVE
ncbi:hypothetical protein [Glycomyces artemisiae]|uniref:Uncharacterized protein n=1 Tax=Glycomyces artemisiae TaxID=1076443 RepID=A0A2T0UXE1_9ACTN|nr:hypothetical protein [Glycomyces artemisiae]PRY62554.1 hypothetical protein B0I28_101888 [Glycomyces artemisiae]